MPGPSKTLPIRLLIAVSLILGLQLALNACYIGLLEWATHVWPPSNWITTLLSILGALCAGTRWVSDAFLLLWLTWGAGSLVSRLLTVIVAVAAQRGCDLLLAMALASDTSVGLALCFELVIVAFAILTGHALMYPLREALGWQLSFFSPKAIERGSGARWSLLQLVGWMAFLSFAFTFARSVMDIGLTDFGSLFSVLARILFEGLVRLLMVGAVIYHWSSGVTPRRGRFAILGVFLLSVITRVLWSWLEGYGPSWAENIFSSLGTFVAALVIVRCLLWAGLRLYGWRHPANPAVVPETGVLVATDPVS